MKLEDIKNKTKDAVDYLVQSLESGHSEVLTQYLGAMARFHTYSFGNVMLIASRPAEVCRRCLERRPCVFTLSTVARRIPRCESPWLFTYYLGSVFLCTSW